MKSKIIKGFKDKINVTLNNLDSIESDILKLSTEISEMIKNDVGRVIFVGAGISADMAKIIIEEMKFNFKLKEGKFISVTAAKSFSGSLDKWKELEEVHQTVIFELGELNLSKDDLLIGLSASGKTKYVLSALDFAIQSNSKTALITDFSDHPMAGKLDFEINTKMGNPVIIGLNTAEGSTIQKIILDSVIYESMYMAGRIYKGCLVYMESASEKIENYCNSVLMQLVGIEKEDAVKLLNEHNKELEVALICGIKNISNSEAKDLLIEHKGDLHKIL